MAQGYGVIDDQRELLLNVDYADPVEAEPEYVWVRVRLPEQWNLVGSGSAALVRRR